MKIAYLDCSSGISGDMCLGALVHAGASLKTIKKELAKIPLRGYGLSEKKAYKPSHSGIEATKIDVKVTSYAGGREHLSKWKKAQSLILGSKLDARIKEKGLRILKSIFLAEAVVHGEPYDRIHLHELSYIDTLVDIFGTLIALKELGVEKVYASPVNTGSGFVKTEHGKLPVPAPATAELLKGFLIYSTGAPYELATPTGAAILKGIAESVETMPLMRVEKIGIGAGDRDIKDSPNVLRIFIGEGRDPSPAGRPASEGITVIETNIDDMNPQIYEHLMDRLFKAGALDVFLTQLIMKKGRPAVMLSALCPEEKTAVMADIILRETTTLGVRFHRAERMTLKRKTETINTEFGKIRVKTAYSDKGLSKSAPEYDDLRRAARKRGLPLIEVEKRVKKGL